MHGSQNNIAYVCVSENNDKLHGKKPHRVD